MSMVYHIGVIKKTLPLALSVLGGCLLAMNTAFAASESAPLASPKPKVVPAILIRKDKLAGADPHLPDFVKARYIGQVVTGSYKICIANAGSIASVDVISSIRDADEAIVKTLRAWRYKPQEIQICFIQFLEFHIEGGGPRGPAAAPTFPPTAAPTANALDDLVYHDATSGQDFTAASGWRVSEPKKQEASCGPIALTQIVLLTAQERVIERTQVLALRQLVASIYRAALGLADIADALPKEGSARKMIVDVALRGDRPTLAGLHQVSITPPLPEAAMTSLASRLDALPAPTVIGGEVRFQVLFELRAPRPGEPPCKAPALR